MTTTPDADALRAELARLDAEEPTLRLPRLEVFGTGSGSDYLGTLGGSTSNLFDQSSTSASAGVRLDGTASRFADAATAVWTWAKAWRTASS